MKVFGVDFTSSPSRQKSITCLPCDFDGRMLTAAAPIHWPNFRDFKDALRADGEWVAGIDFPFGQSRRFVENIGWPGEWSAYVTLVGGLSRDEFKELLNAYKEDRQKGDKEHRRRTDEAGSSISPQKLYGVPVGLMFFEGAKRLLAAGVTVPHLVDGDPKRVVVEAYPGVLARELIGKRGYKNDDRKKQTAAQREARLDIFRVLKFEAKVRYGFDIYAPQALCDDPSGDNLDSLLCAVQAAWAWQKREQGYGAPSSVDRLEGWIADPNVAGRQDAMSLPSFI